jgi:PhzF family phenazine biosynthesis protein
MKMWIVDAFADEVFAGNPAAVVPLKGWLPDEVMQGIAAENNLSETAFIVPNLNSNGRYRLRWFTPTTEVAMCGHATLAAGFVALEELVPTLPFVVFDTHSGPIVVARAEENEEAYTLDLPSKPRVSVTPPAGLVEALSVRVVEAFRARYLTLVLENEAAVRNFTPNDSIERLIEEPEAGMLTITAPADHGKPYDFVCRFFAPGAGISEDPVTGSAFGDIAPYWTQRLKKDVVRGYQASQRGGMVACDPSAETVALTGRAILYARSEIVADLEGPMRLRQRTGQPMRAMPEVAGYPPPQPPRAVREVLADPVPEPAPPRRDDFHAGMAIPRPSRFAAPEPEAPMEPQEDTIHISDLRPGPLSEPMEHVEVREPAPVEPPKPPPVRTFGMSGQVRLDTDLR